MVTIADFPLPTLISTPKSSTVMLVYLVLSCFIVSTDSFAGLSRKSSFSKTASSIATRDVLLHSKSADRAHIERNLEEMMDNDWRVFRAQLVAQERAEQNADPTTDKQQASMPPAPVQQAASDKTESSSNARSYQDDPKLAKQGQLSDLFAGAISSIFKGGATKNGAGSVSDKIFDGKGIGNSKLPKRMMEILGLCEDPFVSEAEIPIHLSPKVSIDKRKWAHEIPHVENGCVLLANEKLGGVFHQTVVLIVQHCDRAGSIGVVINRPMDGDLLKIASEQDSKLDLSLKLAFPSAKVTYGGPVMTDEFAIVHGYGEVEGSTKLCSGVYVGGSEELMNAVRVDRFSPDNALFCKGHAAWVSGQLNREIAKGVWYTAAVSSEFILRYANGAVPSSTSSKQDGSEGTGSTGSVSNEDLWSDILNCMGGKFTDIARNYGGRGDRRMP